MADLSKPKVIVIGGPTASGKTSLSVELAKRFDGEIISADSMQIYRGLDVGTAKATLEEQQGIRHHLLDILEPDEPFSVADYVQRADGCIKDITARGKIPFVVGGTGLYISSLINGIRFTEQRADANLRAVLQERAITEGALALHKELSEIDPEAANGVHPNNVGRVIRAIELFRLTGKTMTQQKAESIPLERPYDTLCFCLDSTDRQRLYDRIDRRVDVMEQKGVLAEAKLVWENKAAYSTAAQAIGYKEYFPYFEGREDLKTCSNKMKQASRNYAKRQLTWFRRMEDVHWLEVESADILGSAERLIMDFLG